MDAERALRESEERYRTLFANMTEGFALGEVILDEHGAPCDFRFLEMNDAFERQSGLNRAATRGRPMRQVLPNLEPSWVDTYCAIALGAPPARFERYNVDLDRHFSVHCFSPARGRFAILFTDISETRRMVAERDRAGQEVQRAHALIEGITRGTDDMIAAQDFEHCYLFFNDAYSREFRKLWGQDLQVGTSMVEALAAWPEERRKAMELWRRALNGESFSITMQFGPSPDEEQVYDLRFHPLQDGEGRRTGAAHILRNVTQQVRTHHALRESEARLRETAAELERANRQLNEFLATLAHELRNPLAPIRTGVEILRLTSGDQGSHDVLAMMKRQLEHTTRLLDDLLDVSRITRGRIALREELFDLSLALEAAVEASRPVIDEMGHDLVLRLPEEPMPVRGDRVRIAQVFTNLLNNAARYTMRGGRIELAARARGSAVEVVVKDNGMGIPAENLASIFEMFFQGDGLARSEGGLGIGLSLVRGLVALHGGTIEARSEGIGRGSEFRVRLPMGAGGAAAPASGASRPGQERRLRILVADDNRDAASSLSMLLSLSGHEVRVANDGGEAVALAERFRPEVALLDLGMPAMSGFEACRAIRSRPWGREVLLVALTGWGQDEDRNRSRAAGFDAHLVKPVGAQELSALLARLATPVLSSFS